MVGGVGIEIMHIRSDRAGRVLESGDFIGSAGRSVQRHDTAGRFEAPLAEEVIPLLGESRPAPGRLESGLGEGTRFSVYLPCVEDESGIGAAAMETADAER